MWMANFVSLTILAVCLEAPLVIIELALHITAGIEISTEDSLAINVVSMPLALYGSLSHHFLSGLLEKLVGSERHGHPQPSLGEILHDLPWVRLLVADLVSTALIVLGFIALIIPGLLLAVWLTPLLVIVNLEGRTVRASMVRSYQLVKGHFWRVFIVGFLALAVVDFFVSIAGSIAEHFSHSVPAEVLAHAIPATLLMPIAALPIVVLTFDLVALDADR
jgi:hypothetical protein